MNHRRPLLTPGSYTQWCRAVFHSAAGDPHANLLFASTLQEPTLLLQRKVTEAFKLGVNPSYRSVFARGNLDTIDAIAARELVDPDWIMCTTGGGSALAIIFRAFLEPGSHAIVERPYFDLFGDLASSCGAELSYWDREGPDFSFNIDRLVSLLRPETKLVALTNLNNPTGAALSDKSLTEIAILAERTGITIIVDEVYADFIIDGSRVGAAARLSPAIVSVNSLSKVYGLFALRCGWIIAQQEARERIQNVYDRFEFGVSKVTHAIAAAVLKDMAPFEQHWQSILSATRPQMIKQASVLETEGLLAGNVPKFGCMYFPKILFSDDDLAVSRFLWENDSLAVAPGSYFGRPGHLRIGFGKEEAAVRDGLDRLRSGLLRYQAKRSIAS